MVAQELLRLRREVMGLELSRATLNGNPLDLESLPMGALPHNGIMVDFKININNEWKLHELCCFNCFVCLLSSFLQICLLFKLHLLNETCDFA